jgi:pimeloyl-ACP methyl ester carboxylesterase
MKFITNKLDVVVMLFLLSVIAGCSSVPTIQKENVSTVNSADGSPITYGVRGEGPVTIVFVHCWTCTHELWRPQIEYFSKHHQVVWLDLAGHGLSHSHRQDYTISAFGEDVAAVVKKIGGENVVLVGHSMGGPVALEAAKLLDENVVGIIGIDTFYTPFDYPKSEAEIEGFVKPFKEDFQGTSEHMVRSMFTPEADPDLVNSIVQQLSVANPDVGISAMYEIFRWYAKSSVSSLEMYSQQLHNINGAPTGKEMALHESVVLIPGVGHFVAQAKPHEFNAALKKIIAELQTH